MPARTHEPEAAVAAVADAARVPPPAQAPLLSGGLMPTNVMRLQRAIGNAAVVETLKRVSVAEAARRLRAAREARRPADAKFRLPTAADLKSLYTGGELDQSVIEDAVYRALKRMDLDFSLRTDAKDYFQKLFPSSGTFDDAAFARMLGSNKLDVYNDVAQAETTVTPGDVTKLRDVVVDADKYIGQAMADAAGLKEVFGSKADVAKTRYDKARQALAEVFKDPAKSLDTDYNRDDPQVALGGWASYKDRHIHLMGDVAEVRDKKKATLVLIHECAHLSDPAVGDQGYYGTPGFEGVPEQTKIDNAAHYEELPARYLGVSLYSGVTFTPGSSASGTPLTFEDEVRRAANEYLRTAWSSALDVFAFVRGVARDMRADPSSKAFTSNKKRLLEISKIAKLTVHLQKPAPHTVTLLDIVLLEGVGRGIALMMKRSVRRLPVDTSKKKTEAVDKLINDCIADFGELTGNATDDRKLVDFFFKQ